MAKFLAKCVDPSSPETFLYFRAIQGRCGGTHVDPTLQEKVLLPSDFAEHISHVGSSHDTHSIVQSGLIPGQKDVKKGRHAVFFTAVNPMFADQHKQVECDLTNPRIDVYKKSLLLPNVLFWCILRVAQSKGLQFCQTRSNTIIFHNTLPAICIERVVYLKSGAELYNKVYQSPRLPQRAVLNPNLYHGRADLSNF